MWKEPKIMSEMHKGYLQILFACVFSHLSSWAPPLPHVGQRLFNTGESSWVSAMRSSNMKQFPCHALLSLGISSKYFSMPPLS